MIVEKSIPQNRSIFQPAIWVDLTELDDGRKDSTALYLRWLKHLQQIILENYLRITLRMSTISLINVDIYESIYILLKAKYKICLF